MPRTDQSLSYSLGYHLALNRLVHVKINQTIIFRDNVHLIWNSTLKKTCCFFFSVNLEIVWSKFLIFKQIFAESPLHVQQGSTDSVKDQI